MKTVLLIDDLRVFRDTPDAELHIARTSEEALNLLYSDPNKHWDEVWFDHDLGMQNGKDDTTMRVADFFAEQSFFGNPISVDKILIHTSNPVGKKNIALTLERWGYPYQYVQAETYFTIDSELYDAAQKSDS